MVFRAGSVGTVLAQVNVCYGPLLVDICFATTGSTSTLEDIRYAALANFFYGKGQLWASEL